MKRLAFLDGLRGIAILCVMLFHAYTRWSQIVPYGNQYASIFRNGRLGVNLFFMISGFVIIMTLEKSANFFEFIFRRWLRLFPAMLIISVFVFCTARTIFPERPAGDVSFRDLIPGLTFIEPFFWGKVLGFPQRALEGVFWSLFVEVKFYLIFGMAFFIFGEIQAIVILICLFALYLIKIPLMTYLAADYMGWFASGALFYLYFKTSKRRYWWLGFIVGLVGPAYFFQKAEVIVVTFFAVVLRSNRMKFLVSFNFFLFLGFISYPLYLIHQNMMVAMIIKFDRWIPQMPSFLLPIMPIVIVAGISWLIAKYLEPKLRDYIRYVAGLITANK